MIPWCGGLFKESSFICRQSTGNPGNPCGFSIVWYFSKPWTNKKPSSIWMALECPNLCVLGSFVIQNESIYQRALAHSRWSSLSWSNPPFWGQRFLGKKRGCHGNRHNAIYGRWDVISVFLQDFFACWYWKLLTAAWKILTLFFCWKRTTKTFQDDFRSFQSLKVRRMRLPIRLLAAQGWEEGSKWRGHM